MLFGMHVVVCIGVVVVDDIDCVAVCYVVAVGCRGCADCMSGGDGCM